MTASRNAVIAGGLIVLLAVFLAGYLPGAQRARRSAEEARSSAETLRRTEQTLSETRIDLRIARLQGQLGHIMLEAEANNFGVALEQATRFFDEVRAVAIGGLLPNSDRRNTLEAILARRDEISADLARANPAVRGKIAEIFMQLSGAVH